MTIGEALRLASHTLAEHSIEGASVEAELLLRHCLGIDRARLYSRLGEEMAPADALALEGLLERRRGGEPAAYIVGWREFFGNQFLVEPGVFIPRPESELLVERALEFVAARYPRGDVAIADVGTGSGAIAISLALALPRARVYAVDLSRLALEVARRNCERHGVAGRVLLLEGSLLEPLPEAVEVVVANLPYVAEGDIEALDEGIRRFEPRQALAGGSDGLDWVRLLLGGVEGRLRVGGVALVEIGAGQGEGAVAAARAALPAAHVEVGRDLAGHERVLEVVP